MARETDFLDLYRLLDLEPGCGLGEFKHAYRRRVAVLHPDRRSDDPHGVAAQRLQQLTAMYGMAMEFHRAHGRLPGAASVRPSPSPAGEAGPAAVAPRVRTSRRRSRRWLLLPAAAIAVWLLWPGEPPSPPAAPPAEIVHHAAPTPLAERPAAQPAWGLGMDAASVRSIEGEPTLMPSDQRWEYGPSWVRFEDGKVVDWYSSPLYPLHVTAHGGAPRGQ
ncbi:J domain-containing protein [Rhodanobacter lindaniclasticus]|uniref:J domain-containing protein n=1 Tax=Rhodanobacter lindaniclasticus TaxID=75310 RepID=A0A4S3KE07_9GAMM|nr:J domain-containing protein [Rhodanobacter lindaniclasticus]THD06716.1 hypothetical protein B1991_11840 [Rhodanobacter lindaniclasticus]